MDNGQCKKWRDNGEQGVLAPCSTGFKLLEIDASVSGSVPDILGRSEECFDSLSLMMFTHVYTFVGSDTALPSCAERTG